MDETSIHMQTQRTATGRGACGGGGMGMAELSSKE